MKTIDFTEDFSPASTSASASLPPDHSPTTTGMVRKQGVGVVRWAAGESLEDLENFMGLESRRNRRSRYKVKLGNRDLELLSSLEIWGVLGLGQIQAVHWKVPELTQEVSLLFNEGFRYVGPAYDRMRKLQRRGWVQIYRFSNERQLYGLTEKAHRLLQAGKLNRLPSFLEKVAPSGVTHRLQVIGTGLLISRILRLPILTERQVRFEQSANADKWVRRECRVPDLVVIGSSGRRLIEVERTQKSAERYDRIWESYRENTRRGELVLYLVPERGRAGTILDRARNRGADFLYILDLPSFRKSLGTAPFINFRGEECVLG